jgi:hypothetical protein
MIDYHAKAMELLEQVANSVHEREPKYPNLLCFNRNEIEVVENWLRGFTDAIHDDLC